MVTIQAKTMLLATFQRTADIRRAAPVWLCRVAITVIEPERSGRLENPPHLLENFHHDGQVLAQTQPSRTIVSDPRQVKSASLTATVIARAMGFHPFKHAGHHQVQQAGKQGAKTAKSSGQGDAGKRPRLHPNPAWAAELSALEAAIRHGGFVVRQLPIDVAAKIMRHHLPGISTVPEMQRWYPDGAVASQLLGFTGIEGSAGAGAGAGLEHQYNDVLAGRPGRQVTITDPGGMVLDTVDVQKPENGRNITLTLSAATQAKTERSAPTDAITRRLSRDGGTTSGAWLSRSAFTASAPFRCFRQSAQFRARCSSISRFSSPSRSPSA